MLDHTEILCGFPNGCAVTFPSTGCKCLFSYILASTLLLSSENGSSTGDVTSHCGFNLCFLGDKWCSASLLYLLVMSVSYVQKCLFLSWFIFLICLSFLCILDNVWPANIFPHSICAVSSLDYLLPLLCRSTFSLMEFYLAIFAWGFLCFCGLVQKSHCLEQCCM
jgi:hypothetical protein